MNLLVLALLAQVTRVKCDYPQVSCRVVDGNCYVTVATMDDALSIAPPKVTKPLNIFVDSELHQMDQRIASADEELKARLADMKKTRDSVPQTPAADYSGALLILLTTLGIGVVEARNRFKKWRAKTEPQRNRRSTVKQWIKTWETKRIHWWRW